MRVTHFDRDTRSGNYTFEQLFTTLRSEFEKHIAIDVFQRPKELNVPQSILWARKQAGQLNHITGDVNYLCLGLPKDKTIITVHDLGHFTRSLSGLKKLIYKKVWMDWPLDRALHITAISEFTKRQLIEFVNIPEEKISVIKNPVLPFIKFSPLPKNSKPIILQIGSGTNKNLSRLIEAVQGLNVKLLLINRLEDPIYLQLLKKYNIDFEQRCDLDQEGLQKAYSDSDIVFFASEYEGFGMPILEAQAVGRPVITGKVSAMPEAVGEGGLVVDPFNVEEIRQVIINLNESEDLKETVIKRGFENLKKYQIGEIASQYINLYERFW
jgi:glycosyltransferase involved in cell wall biosynthesis